MKKSLLILSILLLITPFMFAAQTYVLAEMFTQTWCGYCPGARSALAQMHQNQNQFPYLIPIIWQGDGPHPSPGYATRRNLYGFTGIPHARFCGNDAVGGGGANVYNNYVNAYNRTVTRNAPMEITVRMNVNAQNELVVNADVNMTANITTPNTNIIFVLTYNLTGIMEPNYFASGKTYFAQPFPLNTAGQQQTFTRNHPIDPSWEMDRVTAVVFVQSLEATNPIVHQTGKRSFDGLNTGFTSNVQQGPPALHVQFTNLSMPSQSITSYEWDLTGDGEIDSAEENPFFIYDAPGTYTVTLKISDGVDEAELVMQDYITVLEPQMVSGEISGVFKHEYAPYRIIGDVTVPEDGFLEIEPGLEIHIEGSSIHIRGPFTADALDEEPIVFTSNTTWKGIYLQNSDHPNKVNNCIFNKATETALRVASSNIEIIGNTFHHNNAAGANAGALRIVSSNNTTLRNNVFANNRSTQGVGAVEIEASSFNIVNNLFVNNTGQVAAAMFIKSGSSTDLINNTISHNSYNAANGFHILNSSSYIQVTNCIIRGEGNIFSNLTGAIILADYSNITGGYEGMHIMDADPLFVEPSEGYGDQFDGLHAVWHLQDDSPCVDAGNSHNRYNDPEDPDNPGFARFPAKGTVRNDMGTFGGQDTQYWVSVEDDYIITLPDRNNIISAYPNPFNPDVTISLAGINHLQPVSLQIYNAKGQLVKTLLENELTTNSTFFWNGQDNLNQPASSGLYYIKLINANTTSTRRIILLK